MEAIGDYGAVGLGGIDQHKAVRVGDHSQVRHEAGFPGVTEAILI